MNSTMSTQIVSGTIFCTGMLAGVVGTYLWNKPSCAYIRIFLGSAYAVTVIGIKILIGNNAPKIFCAGFLISTSILLIRKNYSFAQEEIHKSFESIQTTALAQSKQRGGAEKKDFRREIAKQTLDLIQQGFYTNSSKVQKPLQSGDALTRESKLFDCNLFVQDAFPTMPLYETTKIVVIDRNCLDAARDRIEQGKVAVVNFASPIEPGGGFAEGIGSQEEDICWRSELAGFMQKQIDYFCNGEPYFYENGGLYDKLIYTPNVTVFRENYDKDYALLDHPFQVGILTVAAPNKPQLINMGSPKVNYACNEDRKKVKAAIRTQLYVAALKEYTTVILGAFGCGAFSNPPSIIAELYKEACTEFQGYFKEIVFAILDDPNTGSHNPNGNLKPFQSTFNLNNTIDIK